MITSWKQFFDCAAEMRHYQKEYFRLKRRFFLVQSKRKEKELDDCIEHQQQKWASNAEQGRARKLELFENSKETKNGKTKTQCQEN